MERRESTLEASSASAGESRASFCAYLRGRREAQRIALSEIARETRIPLHNLERLEDGRFEELPADVFVRGFLRSYARFLGLDVDETVRRYAACGLAPAPVASDEASKLAPSLGANEGGRGDVGPVQYGRGGAAAEAAEAALTQPRSAPARADAEPAAEPSDSPAEVPNSEPRAPIGENGSRLETPSAAARSEKGESDAKRAAPSDADASGAAKAGGASPPGPDERALQEGESALAGASANSEEGAPPAAKTQGSRRRRRRGRRGKRGRGRGRQGGEHAERGAHSSARAAQSEARDRDGVRAKASEQLSAPRTEGAAEEKPPDGAADSAATAEGAELREAESRALDEAKPRAEAFEPSAKRDRDDAARGEDARGEGEEPDLDDSRGARAPATPRAESAQPVEAIDERPSAGGAEATGGAAERGAKVLRIDDDCPDAAERTGEASPSGETSRAEDTLRSFLLPELSEGERGIRRSGLSLAVLILVIVATLAMSVLLRRPSESSDGVTRAPAQPSSELRARPSAAFLPERAHDER